MFVRSVFYGIKRTQILIYLQKTTNLKQVHEKYAESVTTSILKLGLFNFYQELLVQLRVSVNVSWFERSTHSTFGKQ